jgi:hypothetical protein
MIVGWTVLGTVASYADRWRGSVAVQGRPDASAVLIGQLIVPVLDEPASAT